MRDPANFGVDGLGLSNAIRLPGKLHGLAVREEHPNSIRFITENGMEKIELKNLEIVAELADVKAHGSNTNASRAAALVNDLKHYRSYDEATGENIFLDVEVRGKMAKSKGNRPMYYEATYVVITHPSLKRNADPHALSYHKNLCAARFTCDFAGSVPKKWIRTKAVNPSVAIRM
jgi:hypothetical protein